MEKFNPVHNLFSEKPRFLYYGEAGGEGAVLEAMDGGPGGDDYAESLCGCPEVEDLIRQIEEQDARIDELESQTIVDVVDRSVDGLVAWVGEQYDAAATGLGEFAGGVAQGVGEALNGPKEDLLEAKRGAEQALANLQKALGQKLREVSTLVDQGFHDVLDAGLAGVGDLMEISSWGADQLMDLAEKGIEKGIGLPDQVKDLLVEKGSDIASWGADKALPYLRVVQDLGGDAQKFVGDLAESAGNWTGEMAKQIIEGCQEIGLDTQKILLAIAAGGAELVLSVAETGSELLTKEFWTEAARGIGTWSDAQLAKGIGIVRDAQKDAGVFVDGLLNEAARIVGIGIAEGLDLVDLAVEFGKDTKKVVEAVVAGIESWGATEAQAVVDYIQEKGESAKPMVEALASKAKYVAALALVLPALPFILLGAALTLRVAAVPVLMTVLAKSAADWGGEQFDAALPIIKEHGEAAKVFAEGLLEQGAALPGLAVDKGWELYKAAADIGLAQGAAAEKFAKDLVGRIDEWGDAQIADAVTFAKEQGAAGKALAKNLLSKSEKILATGAENALALLDTALGMGLDIADYAEAIADDISEWGEDGIKGLTDIIDSGKEGFKAIAFAIDKKGIEILEKGTSIGLAVFDTLVGAGLEANSYIEPLVASAETWVEGEIDAAVAVMKKHGERAEAFAQGLVDQGEALSRWGGTKAGEAILAANEAGAKVDKAIVALAGAGAEFTADFLQVVGDKIAIPRDYYLALSKDIQGWGIEKKEQVDAIVTWLEESGNKGKAGARRTYQAARRKQKEWQSEGRAWRTGDKSQTEQIDQ